MKAARHRLALCCMCQNTPPTSTRYIGRRMQAMAGHSCAITLWTHWYTTYIQVHGTHMYLQAMTTCLLQVPGNTTSRVL